MIRRALPPDAPSLHALIRELAAYEKLAHEVVCTVEALTDSLFGGDRPAAEALVAEEEEEEGERIVGFALFFQNYSTFLGRSGLYLEDLFVLPSHRRKGYGKDLLRALARLAVERKLGRFEWAVLDWNEPAKRFYESLGAREMSDWRIYRVTGDALVRLAAT
jgi:GNAT superfamily N-acetyltransferase